jgi:hypothetical protein
MIKLSSEQYQEITRQAFVDELEKDAAVETLLRAPYVALGKGKDILRRIFKQEPKNFAQTHADNFDMATYRFGKKITKPLSNPKGFASDIKGQIIDPPKPVAKIEGQPHVEPEKKRGVISRMFHGTEKALGGITNTAAKPFEKIVDWVHKGDAPAASTIVAESAKRRVNINLNEKPANAYQKAIRMASRTPLTAAPAVYLDTPGASLPGIAGVSAVLHHTVGPEAAGAYAGAFAHIPASHTALVAGPAGAADAIGRRVTSKVFGIKNRPGAHIDKMNQTEDLLNKMKEKMVANPDYVAQHKKSIETLGLARKQLRE